MILMTKEIEGKIPALSSTEEAPFSPRVYVKFFHPLSNWTWYATEYDPDTRTFFGYVDGFEGELGYFNLDELSEVKDSWGLAIERDMYWDSSTTLREVMKK